MSFRDDHDAAIARIDALENELAVAREETTRLETKISRLQREIRRLEGKDDATIEFTPDVNPQRMPRWIGVATSTLGFVVFTLIALIVILGVVSPN